jgi:predicted PurR-regulated permease PerM
LPPGSAAALPRRQWWERASTMVNREQTLHPAGEQSPVNQPSAAPPAPDAPVPVTKVQVELPVATILKVLVTIGAILLLSQIWPILFLVLVGLLIAMVLERPVSWLQERGLPRGFAIAAVLAGATGLVALVLAFVTPGLVTQVRTFWVQLPVYIESALAWTANRWPDFYEQAVAWAETQQQELTPGSLDVRGVLSQGLDLISSFGNVIVVLIIAVYILADQGQSLQGAYELMPPRYARKLRRTIPAVARVVNGYVTGQAINSTLFALFTLILLTALDVPSATVLAIIAAIGDAIPQVGVFLATIPAVLLALTQSVQTALIVAIAYGVYQLVENYITSPRVFSTTLQLRPLVTLVAILIGGKLLGLVGVLLALPVAAAIPAVIEIWREDDASAAYRSPPMG